MKVIVLGSKGMLGRYVWSYFNELNIECIGINRDLLDASKVTLPILEDLFFNHIKVEKDDVVINCMGTIKPRVDSLGDLNAILVNSVFPRVLANFCETHGLKLIHPTTDCVYSGLKGSYNENDKYDVSDIYGMSKAMGEPNNCTVIRTSIIGEEVGCGRSLVEWIKSNANKTVNGFTNHKWNGITCLQFAKLCKKIIDDNNFWVGTKHIHSNTVNKKELIEMISEIYNLNIIVEPKETETKCDRSMTSIYNINVKIPNLLCQIKEMKEFNIK